MNPLIKQINEKQVPPKHVHLWWIGQEGFVIKSQNLVLIKHVQSIRFPREDNHE